MTKLTPKRDWQAYYNAVVNRPPRKTLLTALAAFEQPGVAIDLGCGEGRDTIEILRQNWAVLAIDQNPDAIAILRARSIANIDRLATQIASFEKLELPKPVDLINASFSLPFCSNEDFSCLWIQILNSLGTGGRFCGHLFGERDSWRDRKLINCFTLSQVEALLQPYVIEIEHPGKTPLGEDRYWHVFHIVARKK